MKTRASGRWERRQRGVSSFKDDTVRSSGACTPISLAAALASQRIAGAVYSKESPRLGKAVVRGSTARWRWRGPTPHGLTASRSPQTMWCGPRRCAPSIRAPALPIWAISLLYTAPAMRWLAGPRPAISACTAPDERTVIFELDTPVGAFPVLMREFLPPAPAMCYRSISATAGCARRTG